MHTKYRNFHQPIAEAVSMTVFGITSSTAKADSSRLSTLGTLQNMTGNDSILDPQSDGRFALLRDALVNFTLCGDANLDGKVDDSDYSNIDRGYHMHLNGWSNGDFI